MANPRRSGVLALMLGPILALALSACVIVPAHRPYDTGNVTVEYGDYYYYPHAEVYYSISSGYYFYQSGGIWVRARVLPRQYFLNPSYRVRLRAPEHRPYERFPEHQRLYRPPSYDRGDMDRDRGGRFGDERRGWDRNRDNRYEDQRGDSNRDRDGRFGDRPRDQVRPGDRGDRGNRQQPIYTEPGMRSQPPRLLQRPPQSRPGLNGKPATNRGGPQNGETQGKGRQKQDKRGTRDKSRNQDKDEDNKNQLRLRN